MYRAAAASTLRHSLRRLPFSSSSVSDPLAGAARSLATSSERRLHAPASSRPFGTAAARGSCSGAAVTERPAFASRGLATMDSSGPCKSMHSVQADVVRSENALQANMQLEFDRNKERFAFLRWGSMAFNNMLIVPPGSGIVHSANEHVLPSVVDLKLSGKLRDGVTATDLVLTNYGATMGFFPVDHVTLGYLKLTGRSDEKVEMVEAYLRANNMFVDYNKVRIIQTILDITRNICLTPTAISDSNRKSLLILSRIRPSRMLNHVFQVRKDWHACLGNKVGFKVNPWIKTSLAPGSGAVTKYLQKRLILILRRSQLGKEKMGKDAYFKDIWPSNEEIAEGNPMWNQLSVPKAKRFPWDPNSTYIHDPPFFKDITPTPPGPQSVENAYCLLKFGDSITTDHISPAGSIPRDSPAGKYLLERGVQPKDFNSYGSRRGNDEVMARGTFANIRIVNRLLNGEVGPKTVHVPTGEKLFVFDAAMGVKAVIAKSFERIHRSNLVGMGVIPLCFKPGEDADSLGLTGHERYTIRLPSNVSEIQPGQDVQVVTDNGKSFTCKLRIDTLVELAYFDHGGILHYVLRNLVKRQQ
ncbi:hypothetical protein HU200_051373 [Digitaria exilis]|uniref:Aconitate hydratase n=1 Tax=Digitaria exilis TaxID=1010633 RepID=A0A835E9J4_9POAL|nr:hypothetical protein HU200_051373 [Digitaria exilis]